MCYQFTRLMKNKDNLKCYKCGKKENLHFDVDDIACSVCKKADMIAMPSDLTSENLKKVFGYMDTILSTLFI